MKKLSVRLSVMDGPTPTDQSTDRVGHSRVHATKNDHNSKMWGTDKYNKIPDFKGPVILSRVLRDSTPRFVGPLVRPSVGPSQFTFFWVSPLGEDVPSDYNNV